MVAMRLFSLIEIRDEHRRQAFTTDGNVFFKASVNRQPLPKVHHRASLSTRSGPKTAYSASISSREQMVKILTHPAHPQRPGEPNRISCTGYVCRR